MTGIDNLWIPPGCKASSPSGNGYDVYDLYDLGEFDAKGSVGTKWGTRQELLDLVNKANEIGLGIYWDAVLNHKAGADSTEKCRAVEVDPSSASYPVHLTDATDQCLKIVYNRRPNPRRSKPGWGSTSPPATINTHR